MARSTKSKKSLETVADENVVAVIENGTRFIDMNEPHIIMVIEHYQNGEYFCRRYSSRDGQKYGSNYFSAEYVEKHVNNSQYVILKYKDLVLQETNDAAILVDEYEQYQQTIVPHIENETLSQFAERAIASLTDAEKEAMTTEDDDVISHGLYLAILEPQENGSVSIAVNTESDDTHISISDPHSKEKTMDHIEQYENTGMKDVDVEQQNEASAKNTQRIGGTVSNDAAEMLFDVMKTYGINKNEALEMGIRLLISAETSLLKQLLTDVYTQRINDIFKE